MDVGDITKMKYTMATTRVGRLLKDGKVCDAPEVKKGNLGDANPVTVKKDNLGGARPVTVKKEKLRDAKPYDRPAVVKKEEQVERRVWRIGNEVQKICVEYHMTQTLEDWGIEPIRPHWPEQDQGKVRVDP